MKTAWSGNLTTGTNTYTGTSGTSLLLTAGASGSFIRSIMCEAAGTNVATVVRVFVNNGSTEATATNNALILQFSLPATTATATAATAHLEIPLNLAIQSGYTIRVVLATSVAAGWQFTAFYGDL
jgi:hypothetical protein